MRYPMAVIWDDERLTALLRPTAESAGALVREPRQAGACLRLLGRGEPAVLVLRVGRDLEREMGLLERATRVHPEAARVVVAEGDHARLAGLARDLGATFVHAPPMPRELLVEVVAALLRPGGGP